MNGQQQTLQKHSSKEVSDSRNAIQKAVQQSSVQIKTKINHLKYELKQQAKLAKLDSVAKKFEPLLKSQLKKTQEVVKAADQVRYVEDKTVSAADVWKLLTISKQKNQWSNFGPVSQLLEQEVAEFANLDKDLRVVFCANATIAIHAMVNMIEHKMGRALHWATSAFGFYSTIDGPLQQARMVDCNTKGMLDLSGLKASDEAIVVTNMFGQEASLSEYRTYAREQNKPIIVDAAVALGSHHHRENECISFHHTKPWGFGEAGCAIVHESDETLFRELISFGHVKGDPILRSATNGKISDISCAFVLQRVKKMREIGEVYQQQYQRIEAIGRELGLQTLSDKPHPSIPSNVPFIFPNPICSSSFQEQVLPLGKYYHPLNTSSLNANTIYSKAVNVPCHSQMALFSDTDIENSLRTLFIISKKTANDLRNA